MHFVVFQSKIAFTFSKSIFKPSSEKTNTKYTNFVWRNVHFFKFTSNFSFFNDCKTFLAFSKCLSFLLFKINRSSNYTMTNFHKNSFQTSFICLICMLGALVSQNGIIAIQIVHLLPWKMPSIHHFPLF